MDATRFHGDRGCEITHEASWEKDQDFDSTRFDLVVAVATLPDEAFGWLMGTLESISQTAGGFMAPSRAALEACGPLVTAYFAKLNEQRAGQAAAASSSTPPAGK